MGIGKLGLRYTGQMRAGLAHAIQNPGAEADNSVIRFYLSTIQVVQEEVFRKEKPKSYPELPHISLRTSLPPL